MINSIDFVIISIDKTMIATGLIDKTRKQDNHRLIPGLLLRFQFQTDQKPKIGELWSLSWETTTENSLDELQANLISCQKKETQEQILKIKVDAEGNISVIGDEPSGFETGKWKAHLIKPHKGLIDQAPQYIEYTPSPAGNYLCNILDRKITADDALKKRELYLLRLQVEVPTESSSPATAARTKSQIEFVAAAFDWNYTEPGTVKLNEGLISITSAIAIPLHQHTLSELPSRRKKIVAISIGELTKAFSIFCCFRTDATYLKNNVIHVRAISGTKGIMNTIAQSAFGFTTTDHENAKYIYASRFIAGTTELYDGFIPVTVNLTAQNGLDAVGEYEQDWQWQSSLKPPGTKNQTWEKITTTAVSLCLTLGKPQHPWNKAWDGLFYPPSPPEDLLQLTCRWAQGAKTASDVLILLTNRLFDQSNFFYTSSSHTFSTYYTDSNGIPTSSSDRDKQDIVFNIKLLGQALYNMIGQPVYGNCVDFSHTLMLLGNIIGCQVSILTLYSNQKRDITFSITDTTDDGPPKKSSFPYRFHQVAYLGDIASGTAMVFDPCFRLSNNELAVGMPLKKYIELLAPGQPIIAEESKISNRIRLI